MVKERDWECIKFSFGSLSLASRELSVSSVDTHEKNGWIGREKQSSKSFSLAQIHSLTSSSVSHGKGGSSWYKTPFGELFATLKPNQSLGTSHVIRETPKSLISKQTIKKLVYINRKREDKDGYHDTS